MGLVLTGVRINKLITAKIEALRLRYSVSKAYIRCLTSYDSLIEDRSSLIDK